MEFYGSTHNHTDFSNFRLRDSINSLEKLCYYAANDLKHDFIAITEHETVANTIAIEKLQSKMEKDYPNFKIIKGNEIYLCRENLNPENFIRGQDKFYHFILLATDEIGHKQLREISTRAWKRSFSQGKMIRVPTYYSDLIEVIGENRGHLIAQTACIGGYLGQTILKEGVTDKLLNWIDVISQIFGKENFFLETQPSFNEEQIEVNNTIKLLSNDLNIPVVITTDSHYLKKEDAAIHKAFLNAQEGDRETEKFYATTYMMSREELHSYMDNYVGSETVTQWLNNSKLIYDKCSNYSIQKPLRIPYLPRTIDTISDEEFNQFKDKIKELDYFYNSKFKVNKDLAAAIVKKILKDNEYDNEETFAHIDDNLKAIRLLSEKQNTQWSAYLLNMRDYIKIIWEKGNSLVGCSRGSGGGFLLLNMLDITQINPVKEKAPLRSWRFLNPERVSPLDIDTDIEGGKREQVYKAFQEEYGENRVSKVLTLRKEKSKSALLTAARGCGVDADSAAYLSSFIKSDRGQMRTLHQTYYGDIENDILPDKKFQKLMDEEYAEVWEVAKYIEGLICGVGSHAGGVIFFDEEITESTALMKTTNGDLVTQFDLHDAENCGLIKIDLLSIEALDRIRATLDLLVEYDYIKKDNKTLKEIYEEAIGIYNLERDDVKMWKMLHDHKVESCFQMEKESGIKGIRLALPQSVEELATINSVK